jgi:hypothetical protein
MDPNWRQPYGLRPTLRHLMILVVHFALLSALAAPLVKGGEFGLMTLLLPVSLPLLSLLIFLFDRPSPAKYWLAGLLTSLFLPSFVAWCDVLAAVAWALVWTHAAMWFLLIVLNSLAVTSILGVVRRLPRRCPECGLRSLLPLGRRSSGLLWCASCGFRARGALRRSTG